MDGSLNFLQNFRRALIGLSAVAAALCLNTSVAQDGRAAYDKTCAGCHAKAVAGTPQSNDSAAWQVRLNKNGYSGLFDSAIKGKGAMPPKGGNAALSEDEVMSAVTHMWRLATAGAGGPIVAPTTKAAKPTEVASAKGRDAYQASCASCHMTGIAGAPKSGDPAAWAARVKTGNSALYASAIKGKGAMPAKGGNAGLSDDAVKGAVDFMLAQIGTAPVAKASAPVKVADVTPAAVADAAPAARDTAQTPVPPPAQAAAAPPGPIAGDVNSFNRLMQAPGKRNLPPLEDGIHDVTNEATALLQAPLQAYAGMAKSNAGNRIDWVKALNDKKLQPRADKQDPKAEMAVLEMNIVREVKGSMPDVVFPHRQHTQWLDCSNCHPAIFIPQKGANQMSMASIILGQQCGVCHGKVAFPISECRLCHLKSKDPASVSAGIKP